MTHLLFRLGLILAALANSVEAQRLLHFGTNVVEPGKVMEFTAPLNAAGRMEASALRLTLAPVRGAFIAPPGLTNLLKPWPLVIFSVPSGGSAIRAMHSMTNVALSEGWAVLAADGLPVDASLDSVQFGWGMLSSVLDQFHRTWPPTKQWPIACAGFSGGAKRSASTAAALVKGGSPVVGIFLGGCNEDRATFGLQLYQPGDRFKLVPIFMSNGTSDPIAGPTQAAAVVDSMRKSGFRNLRIESYPGGHQANNEQLAQALRWFSELRGWPTKSGL